MTVPQNTQGIFTQDTPLPTQGDRYGLRCNSPGHSGETCNPNLGMRSQEGLIEGFIEAKRFKLRIKERETAQAKLPRTQQVGPSFERSHIAFWKLLMVS